MTSQQFFVARGRSIKLPNRDVRTVADPRTGRKIRTCTTPGGFLRGGAMLPQDLVEFAQSKRESNGSSLLQNWIDTGFVVFNQGDSSPLEDIAPPLPIERTLVARPRQD